MNKGTIIFDFDSTLIKDESFELMLENKLKKNPQILEKIKSITDKGMNGEVSFEDSVLARFQLACPSLEDIDRFIKNNLPSRLSDGIKNLCDQLIKDNFDLWIVSGGLKKAIMPFAQYLNIKKERVIALEGLWDDKGQFLKIKKTPSLESKVQALEEILPQLKKPIIAIGDGFTDYQLYEAKIANYFILYTEHQKREKVYNLAKIKANSVKVLKAQIEKVINQIN